MTDGVYQSAHVVPRGKRKPYADAVDGIVNVILCFGFAAAMGSGGGGAGEGESAAVSGGGGSGLGRDMPWAPRIRARLMQDPSFHGFPSGFE